LKGITERKRESEGRDPKRSRRKGYVRKKQRRQKEGREYTEERTTKEEQKRGVV